MFSEKPSPTPFNVYNHTRPASPEVFVGQDDAFALIRGYLAGGAVPCVPLLIGSRKIGKTSILLNTPAHIERRYLPAYLDLGDMAEVWFEVSDEEALVQALHERLTYVGAEAVERAANGVFRPPPLPSVFPTDPHQWAAWFVETYFAPLVTVDRRLRRIVFLIDRLDQREGRYPLPSAWMAALSEALGEDERLAFVFAVDSDAEPALMDFPLAANPLLRLRLAPLSDAAAKRLISEPVASLYTVTDDALEGILSMGGGHPYLLTVIGDQLWDHSFARNHSADITLADVETILPHAIFVADDFLRETLTTAIPYGSLALHTLSTLIQANGGLPVTLEAIRGWLFAQMDTPPDDAEIAATLRALEYGNIVRTPKAGHYTFVAGLYHIWLQRESTGAPPTTLPADRPEPRRLIAPLLLMALILIGAVFVLFRVGGMEAGISSEAPTLTLPLDVQATQRMLGLTQTFVALPTATVTNTATFTPTHTYTFTPTRTATATPSQTATASQTLTPTATFTVSQTATPSPTFTPSLSYTPSQTAATTASLTPTATATMSLTPNPTATFTPTATATFTPTATATPPPSVTPPPFPTGQILATQAP
ncbi:MAG TPA: hypothetical protein PLD47_07935 [Aggregatilineales bacterium]|nr:hypothetical protein [Anaerolineales bacterium]HRE47638.1 hypothetical protein [Aggregatilineales bacterium]